MRRYVVAVALLLVVVPLAVVVSDEVPNDDPAFCLLVNGVSWLPVDSLPDALRQRVTDKTATQVMNGLTVVPIKRFVEAHGGSVGWDSAAGAVTVEFEGQNIAFKALHSESFWASPSVRTLRAALLSVSTDSKSEPSTESGTNPSEEWEPPRLVDGVWVTSGVSDEVAKQYAAEYERTKKQKEQKEQEEQKALRQKAWDDAYAQQQGWGLPAYAYTFQKPATIAWLQELYGVTDEMLWRRPSPRRFAEDDWHRFIPPVDRRGGPPMPSKWDDPTYFRGWSTSDREFFHWAAPLVGPGAAEGIMDEVDELFRRW